MTKHMSGIVTMVAESRFQLTDDAGVSHFFVLGHGAAAEPADLTPLQHRQARIRVRYEAAPNLIGDVATEIHLAD